MATRTKQQSSGRMLDILNQAINVELTVSQHYWSRAAYWSGVAGMTKLEEYYRKEADEERGHAKLAIDRSVFLGGKPVLKPQAESPSQGSLKQQLAEDLAGEVAVADQYVEWTQIALDLEDFTTRCVFEKILRETEEHVDWLQQQLVQIDLMGEEVYAQTWK